MIREEIGDALWLGCGCPLWASIGLVDGVRIGRDVGVVWSGDYSAQSLLRDQSCRNFANQILWQGDPDCVLLRERFHDLSEEEVQSLAIYAGMTGGVMMTSDHLGELSPERLQLWRLLLNEERTICEFPTLGQTDIFYEGIASAQSRGPRYTAKAEDPILVQVRRPVRKDAVGAVFFLNISSRTVQRSYSLMDLGIKESVYLCNWMDRHSSEEATSKIAITLRGHHSALFFFSREPIQEIPPSLPA
jgi:hypothetical protein